QYRSTFGALTADGKPDNVGQSIPSSERHKTAGTALFPFFAPFQSLGCFCSSLMSYHFRPILPHFTLRGTTIRTFPNRVVPWERLLDGLAKTALRPTRPRSLLKEGA